VESAAVDALYSIADVAPLICPVPPDVVGGMPVSPLGEAGLAGIASVCGSLSLVVVRLPVFTILMEVFIQDSEIGISPVAGLPVELAVTAVPLIL